MTRLEMSARLLVETAVLCVVAATLSACALVLPGPLTGHVSGAVYRVGGPVARNAQPRQPERTSARVTAERAGAGRTGTNAADTGTDGSFGFDLPAGTYTLAGTLTGPSSGDRISPPR